MSGSIAAIAAYNGTGTQGYQTTDKTIPGVKSIFWNENDTDKYYVNGSALIDIPANIAEIAFNNTQPAIFTFPNDVDAVGRIYVQITINNPTNLPIINSDYNNSTGIVDFIELCVGNQIIVSKNFAQIFSIAATQYYQGDYDQNQLVGNGGVQPGNKVKLTFQLDLMENTPLSNNDINLVYLMACANNQTLQLKIYPSTAATLSARGFQSGAACDGINFGVFSRVYSMVNDERNFLRNQVIPKLFKVTQYSDRITVPSSPSPENPIIVNCDSFNIDAKSIDIYIPPTYNSKTAGFDVELFLNSTSYSGLVPFTLGLIDSPPNASWSDYNGEIPNFRLNLSTRTVSGLNKSDLVPLSKYDSIRVYIYFQSGLPKTSSDLDILTNGITVVADGYCTALYQNGAVTFNNY